MSDIQPGDLVVRTRRKPPRPYRLSTIPAPRPGTIARCIEVTGPYAPGVYGIIVEGYPSDHYDESWAIEGWEPIRPADEQFTTLIKRRKPVDA